MNTPKNSGVSTEQGHRSMPASEQWHAKLIERYIQTRIIDAHASADAKKEQEIRAELDESTVREKAVLLHDLVVAFAIDQRERVKAGEEDHEEGVAKVSPNIVSRIKILFNDPAVRRLIPETYGKARHDTLTFNTKAIGKLWYDVQQELKQKQEKYLKLERQHNLRQVKGEVARIEVEEDLKSCAKDIIRLQSRADAIRSLSAPSETEHPFAHTEQNTDVIAQIQYDEIRRYQGQLKKNFVWSDTRLDIHADTVNAILNHRWPYLIGEGGSGKSEQADAAAVELTGELPLRVQCRENTDEEDLIGYQNVKDGVGYMEYGPLMQAFTGYENSLQKEPTHKTGRIVRFDEAGFLRKRAYAILKEARQLRPGSLFHGKPVLPGVGAILTSNPPGDRYPGREPLDVSLRREFALLNVPYIGNSPERPELHELGLAMLLNKNGVTNVAKEELAPAYERHDIPEDQRMILSDGSKVVGEDRLIVDPTDPRHGVMWRFTNAIKAIQDSFVAGNTQSQIPTHSLLRCVEVEDGSVEIKTDGTGEALTLNSTITVGEMRSWIEGFRDRLMKKTKAFHVETLTEWLDHKIDTYIKQADSADKEKLRAVFKHFHLLDGEMKPNIHNSKPLTPKEIGYLSPRVPRPWYIEAPAPVEIGEGEGVSPAEEPTAPPEVYETNEVMLESGNRVLIRAQECNIDGLPIRVGSRMMVSGKDVKYAGMVEDKNHPDNGKPVGEFVEEKGLFTVFSTETKDDFERGLLYSQNLEYLRKVEYFMEQIRGFWKRECTGNPKNNPDNLEIIAS